MSKELSIRNGNTELISGGIDEDLDTYIYVRKGNSINTIYLNIRQLKQLKEHIDYLLSDSGKINIDLNGVDLIAIERERQIKVHGYNHILDERHNDEELVKAAITYLMPNYLKDSNDPYPIWPWEKKYYKPSPDNRIRELQKAGALISAEIDRIKKEK